MRLTLTDNERRSVANRRDDVAREAQMRDPNPQIVRELSYSLIFIDTSSMCQTSLRNT